MSSRVPPRNPVSLDAGSTEPRPFGRSSKKRRVEASVVDDFEDLERSSSNQDGSKLEINHVVPRAIQIQLLCKYREEIEPVFPFPIMKVYEELRERSPLLLQAVVYAASPGVLSSGVQDELTSIVMKLAILVATFWYRTPKNQIHIAIDRFIDLAISVSDDIGISKLDCALSVASANLGDQVSSSDAWRTWNLCYLLSASLGSSMRIPPKIAWDADLEMKLSSLEYGRDALSTDGFLYRFVRAERLCQQITVEAGYHGSDSTLEVTDHAEIRRIQNLIRDRKAQVYSSVSCPSLKLYEHVATLYLHERILHTPTNKRSFAAPYVAERLSMSDFPAPLVTPSDIPFLYGLRDACRAVLNTIMAFEVMEIAPPPLLMLSAKAYYANWLLTKLYIAVTASGNTYGAFINAESLELENHLGKMADLGDTICTIDEAYVAGKGLLSAKRLR
ncbi:uncharacterized protein PAC_14907 [Phialocephala subalpina]|uniref:Transcription factor domain-containing protein n=1 Tax=Phialocephala subalpina TaxID=576137 RepID=A0A1L7XJ72_9HELO|nr:uncharacterized protein PAC_14907 [Phialocephala subalpina]